jgi:hypothetical protein
MKPEMAFPEQILTINYKNNIGNGGIAKKSASAARLGDYFLLMECFALIRSDTVTVNTQSSSSTVPQPG